MKKGKTAFTLVELIVVITILAILGTIGFLSFQGYSSDSRDAVRSADIGNIRTSLGIFDTKVGKYPMPTNITSITYSGAIAWNQGTFGSETFTQLGDINKLPKDPLTENEYTYSVTSNKTEYEISGVYEGNISKTKNKELLNKSYAEGNISGISKIAGTYNGVSLSVNTGTTTYTVFSPSIIGDLTSTDLEVIVNSNKLVVNGSSKLPSSYINSKFKDTTINLGIGSNNGGSILISTGSIGELKSTSQEGKTARIEYVKNLQKVLSGSVISSNYTELIELDTTDITETNLTKIDSIAMNVVSGKWSPKITTTITSTPVIPIANSCATQPSYTNATFTTGTPTTVNQEWQSTNNANPCYYTCTNGYTGSDCSTPANSCATQPIITNGTGYTVGTPTSANQAWTYSSTPGNCTYSCTNGYSGSNCNIAPIANCTSGQGFNGTSCITATQCITGLESITLSNGQTWSCKNLGATTVWDGSSTFTCNSSTDCSNKPSWAGDYYQWGKNDTLWETSWNPGDSLWGGNTSDTKTSNGDGTTSILRQGPCPIGRHVPSIKEIQDGCSNILSVTCSNGMIYNNLISSKLKLPFSGWRDYLNGNYLSPTDAGYWTSSPSGIYAYILYFTSVGNQIGANNIGNRTYGAKIRCLKN